MEEKEYGRGITMRELGSLLIRRAPILVSVALAFVLFTAFLLPHFQPPRYESTAVLYILRKDGQTDLSDDLSYDFSTALKVVNDCAYLMKSDPVLTEVSACLGGDVAPAELAGAMTLKNPRDTRILEVIVEAASPAEAKRIADTLCAVGVKKINDLVGFDQVRLYANGTLPTAPANRPSPLFCIAVGLLAAVLLYAVFVWILLLDDRLRTDAEFERTLGIGVIGDLPEECNAQVPTAQETRLAYETLRANLRFSGAWERGILALVPMQERDGALTAAHRLGAAFSALGERVLVVDADWRRGGTAEDAGLSSVLNGSALTDECISASAEAFFLPSGRTEAPSELLEGEAFRALLSELRTAYDRVIVVPPPLGEAIDGAVVASKCDAVIAAFGYGRVRRGDAVRYLRTLSQSGTEICGAVRMHRGSSHFLKLRRKR